MSAKDNLGDQFENRLGHCFYLAGREHMDRQFEKQEPTILHHGSIQGFGNPRISHAWLEHPETGEIWEPITNQKYDPFVFKHFFNAQTEHQYTWNQSSAHMQKFKHWGPWEEMNQP